MAKDNIQQEGFICPAFIHMTLGIIRLGGWSVQQPLPKQIPFRDLCPHSNLVDHFHNTAQSLQWYRKPVRLTQWLCVSRWRCSDCAYLAFTNSLTFLLEFSLHRRKYITKITGVNVNWLRNDRIYCRKRLLLQSRNLLTYNMLLKIQTIFSVDNVTVPWLESQKSPFCKGLNAF